MTEIQKLINLTDDQIPELEIFLTNFFGNSTQIEKNKILHGKYLLVEYSNSNKIKTIQLDETFILKEDFISQINQALFFENDFQVDSQIIFSPTCIERYFRFENILQILPVPTNAPRLDPYLASASHPFVLEYSFKKSNIWEINAYRSRKRSNELILLLNSLLRLGIELVDNQSSYEWVYSTFNNALKCEYLPLSYVLNEVDTREKDENGFTNCIQYEAFDYRNYNEYYSYHVGSSRELHNSLPTNFIASIERYLQLSQQEKEDFLRSSYWTQVAKKVFKISMSAAFSSLVTAVEVFLPNPEERCPRCNKPTSKDVCSTCNQPNSGPTKYFREFIEKYASGVDARSRKSLYNLRSSITHGGHLMPSDLKEYSFSPRSNQASGHWHLMNSIVKILQNNWLHSNEKK